MEVIFEERGLGTSFSVAALPRQASFDTVLMVSPDHYDVVYAINPHMADEAGGLRSVDRDAAWRQWDALRKTYESLGYPVRVLPGVPGLPDMVFAANQAFPFVDPDGLPAVLLSTMRHPERRPEVPHVAQWFEGRARPVARSADAPSVEGNGDILWFPGRRLLLGGFGFRTERAALAEVAQAAGCPLLGLELVDPHFYHLDTCLAPLDGGAALWVADAFSPESRRLLSRVFPRLQDIPVGEAEGALACNAHCPDGRNVIVDTAASTTMAVLETLGFRVHGVDTSEFRKAGGSVFCLKLMLPKGL